MTEIELKEIKEDYIKHLQRYIKETGGLFPHISVFAIDKQSDGNQKAIIHIPLSDDVMESDVTKDEFVEKQLPMAFKEIKERFDYKAVGWASEAWMRVLDKNQEMPDNYKKIPIKKEVIFVSFETKNSRETIIYDIKREGKQINADGDLTDIVTLTEAQESGSQSGSSGRFSGLFDLLEKV